jgi:hypothetical protein
VTAQVVAWQFDTLSGIWDLTLRVGEDRAGIELGGRVIVAALASAPPEPLRISREECVGVYGAMSRHTPVPYTPARALAHALRTVLNRPGEPPRVVIEEVEG